MVTQKELVFELVVKRTDVNYMKDTGVDWYRAALGFDSVHLDIRATTKWLTDLAFYFIVLFIYLFVFFWPKSLPSFLILSA